MGLTFQSSKANAMKDLFKVEREKDKYIIALAGNPNTGKSTVFNSLTGLHQHTGNWPGKTVVNARGEFSHKGKNFILVDLPGTYSLFAYSAEETVARDFICFGEADATVIVLDATCLERNLNLALQILELTDKVVLCINLMDEAKKKNIDIDKDGLEKELGVPIVLTAARNNVGIEELKEQILYSVKSNKNPEAFRLTYEANIEEKVKDIEKELSEKYNFSNNRWIALRILDGDESLWNSMQDYLEDEMWQHLKELSDKNHMGIDKVKLREDFINTNYKKIEELKNKYVRQESSFKDKDEKIDSIITSKKFGIPLMLLCLAIVFWITIRGANIPSEILANILFGFEEKLSNFFINIGAPNWLHGVLVLGLYRTLAWVVSVMLPPMAIFFPIFTLLEDLGYLPRIAFNLDHLFKKACAHGKQCLTMCMGLGCNAAGIIGCRIIESPRERLIAIITNNFIPCNGRFPTLIAISSVFFMVLSKGSSSIISALMVTLMVVLGIVVTLITSYILSKTLLKGVPSTFTLELPPYRKPQIGRILYTSIIDRTIFVLSRAALVAAPAGALTWILANIYIGDLSIIGHLSSFLNPFAKLIGLDGYILMAFILGFPANEIVLPILLMSYLATGSMISFDSIDSLREILINNGWTYITALNTMLFSLLHWPCATSLWTISRETGSKKWTLIAFLLPTTIAIVVCFITNSIYRLLF